MSVHIHNHGKTNSPSQSDNKEISSNIVFKCDDLDEEFSSKHDLNIQQRKSMMIVLGHAMTATFKQILVNGKGSI